MANQNLIIEFYDIYKKKLRLLEKAKKRRGCDNSILNPLEYKKYQILNQQERNLLIKNLTKTKDKDIPETDVLQKYLELKEIVEKQEEITNAEFMIFLRKWKEAQRKYAAKKIASQDDDIYNNKNKSSSTYQLLSGKFRYDALSRDEKSMVEETLKNNRINSIQKYDF